MNRPGRRFRDSYHMQTSRVVGRHGPKSVALSLPTRRYSISGLPPSSPEATTQTPRAPFQIRKTRAPCCLACFPDRLLYPAHAGIDTLL